MPCRAAKAAARVRSRAATAVTATPATARAGRIRADGAIRAAPSTPMRSMPRLYRECLPGSALRDEHHEVALAVLERGVPLLGAGRPERLVSVGEDHVWLVTDHGAERAQPRDSTFDVVDREIQQRGGRAPLDQQPDPVEVEEDQAGRVIDGARGDVE